MNRASRRLVFCLIVALLLCSAVYAQQRVWTPEEKAFLETANKPIAYTVPGMETVKVIKDVQYKKTDNPYLKMDVYIPSGLSQSDSRPAVILIAGGSGKDGEYEPKNWRSYQTRGRLLAASGLVAVMFTHRLGFPDLAIAEGAQDLEAVMSHVRANAEQYNIDRDNIALMTYSGGGPLLTLGMMGKKPYIKCLVAVYSILDVQENEFALESVTKEDREKFSAVNYVKGGASVPPLMIIRAGKDRIPNLNKILDNFVQKAIAANWSVDFMNHPDGAHGFDNKEPHPRTTEIMKRTVEFLKEHLLQSRMES